MRGACETCKCREYQARDDSPHGGNTGHGASTTTVERDPSGRFAGAATQRCAMCHHSVMVHLAMDLSRARRKARALSARRGKERHAVREGRRTPATARFTAPGGSRLPGPSANAVRAVEARAAAATLGTQEAPPAPPRHEIDLDLFNQLRVKYRNRHCNRCVMCCAVLLVARGSTVTRASGVCVHCSQVVRTKQAASTPREPDMVSCRGVRAQP